MSGLGCKMAAEPGQQDGGGARGSRTGSLGNLPRNLHVGPSRPYQLGRRLRWEDRNTINLHGFHRTSFSSSLFRSWGVPVWRKNEEFDGRAECEIVGKCFPFILWQLLWPTLLKLLPSDVYQLSALFPGLLFPQLKKKKCRIVVLMDFHCFGNQSSWLINDSPALSLVKRFFSFERQPVQ